MAAPTTLALPVRHRAASVRAASFDEASNSVEIIWTTGARVRRRTWDDGVFDEELIVDTASVRLGRLNSGSAPFLNTHDDHELSSVIGSVVEGSAKIVGGKGVARVALSVAEEHAGIVANIKAGIIRNVSVGYQIHKVEKSESDDGQVPIWRVVDWEPLEISAVPIPADAGAQVRAGSKTYPATIATKESQMADPTTPTTTGELALERTRSATIADLGRQFDQADLAADAIRDGTPLADFRRALNDRLVEEQERAAPGGVRSTHGAAYPAPRGVGDLDQRRAKAMENALLHRVDPVSHPLTPGAETYVAMPLLEIARASVEARGVRTAGLSKMNLAGEALAQRSGGFLSSSDFPSILAGVTNTVLRAAYDVAPQTFRPLVRVTTVPDFKTVTRVQLGEAPALNKVNEHGEFKRGSLGEGKESYKIATYGKIIAITRQAIVNDDLDAFARVPRAYGQQAAQLESDLVWAQILANPVMGDGNALFSAAHGNLAASGAAPSVTTLSAARTAFATQTGLDGKTVLGLTPRYIIVPLALLTVTEQIIAPLTPAQTANVVPESLRRIVPIAEPRLDVGINRPEDDIVASGSATAWYLAGDTGTGDIIELAYLEGQQGIYTETRQGFDIDGVEIKARLDVGAKVLEHRNLYKNPGA